MRNPRASIRQAAAAAALTVGLATAAQAAITDHLVVHLTFDSNLTDTSARGNNGTAVGTVPFVDGKIGKGVECSGKKDNSIQNYVTLGAPADLNFGTSTDFSISFWAKFNTWAGDPAFLGNKDWGSGGNPGWVIATSGDGRLQWNYSGPGSGRKDYDGPGGTMSNGAWHHVVFTVLRAGETVTYIDGEEVNRGDTSAGLNNVDTPAGFATNIGQDGTGRYTDGGGVEWTDLAIDDVGIWRRVLGGAEAKLIFEAGNQGKDLSTVVSPAADAPTIVKAPTGGAVIAGQSIDLKVIPGGSSPFTYQWKLGGNPVPGATNGIYSISNAQAAAALAGNYTVTVANSLSSVTSDPVELTVDSTQAPEITQAPAAQVSAPGGKVTFLVAARGAEPLTYQWSKDNVALSGATGATLIVTGITPSSAGLYSVAVKAANGLTTISPPVPLSIVSDIKQGLVAHLTFDDTYNDKTSKGNNGTAVGAPVFVPGKIGTKAVKVSNDGVPAGDGGVFNYVTLGTPADLDFGTDVDFSVAAWVKFTDWKGDPAIVGNKDWGSSGNVGWVMATAGNGGYQWNFKEQGAGRADYDGPTGLSNGKWHHVVATFQRGGRAITYVDGKKVADQDCPTAGTSIDAGLPVNIGQDGTGTYTDGNSAVRWGDCAIDDVAIWRRVITGDEVLNVYNRGEYFGLTLEDAAVTDDLLAYLPFEGNNKDSSGRALDGTAVGTPGFKAGKVGQSLAYASAKDGSSFNYVTLGRPSDLNFGKDTDFSVAFWGRLGTWEGDPAFVGNKDWNGGANQGWVAAASGDGHFQWNMGERQPGGSGGQRADYDGPSGLLTGGSWHHFVVTFDRGGNGVTYVDGVAVGTNTVANVTGTLDTPEGQATNIGQDGKGSYTDGNSVGVTDGQMDEVAVWRRALSPVDVSTLFTNGSNSKNLFGQTVATAAPPTVAVTANADGTVTLNYTGTLQSSATLGGTFTPVAGATSPYTVTPATGPTSQLYRASN